jgi:pimeloyl-ACP methyl ester carboxylesterase
MKRYRSRKAEQALLSSYDRLIAEWGVPVTPLDLPTSFGTTRVNRFGREDEVAPVLLLFHGVGDDSALMWIYNAAALAPHFRLFAIDTLGGPGKSQPNAHYVRAFDDVEWMDELLDGLQLERPTSPEFPTADTWSSSIPSPDRAGSFKLRHSLPAFRCLKRVAR